MKFFKFVLIISALTFFIFACSQSSTNNNSNTINRNVNGINVSTDSAPANSSSETNSSPANDEFAAVRKIYAENCVICHKETGEGGSIELEGAKFKVPSYKSDKAMKASDEKLLDYIENGDDEMPPFKGKLSPEEMKSLVKFIRKEFQGK